ncbi:MAG: adenylate cyclase [Rhizobium sp. 63-7]|nr:MAG: adenylate cyclase [Rhizobium sp. 63-7]
MAKEIERKFLVLDTHWREFASAGATFQQAYIASMDDRSVRVRVIEGQKALLTIKIGRNALAREEFEYEIPLADACDMIKQAIGIVIEKTRYEVVHRGFTWEIDVYDGIYRGLTVAEVEMKHEADNPALPDWLGPEVTGDHRYSNQSLATEDLREEIGYGISHPA